MPRGVWCICAWWSESFHVLKNIYTIVLPRAGGSAKGKIVKVHERLYSNGTTVHGLCYGSIHVSARQHKHPPTPGNTRARVQVNHKFHLDSEEAVYKVTVEAPLNLELVMLQSNKPMRLVDTESNQASHARVHTHTRTIGPRCRA